MPKHAPRLMRYTACIPHQNIILIGMVLVLFVYISLTIIVLSFFFFGLEKMSCCWLNEIKSNYVLNQ